MPSASSHVRHESSAASSTSLTLCLDMCAARAIAFCDRPDARSLRASLALILLAMLYLLGLGCMDSRNVPGGGADGNIGGAERQYSGCERTVLKRNIAGFKEDDYSATYKICY